MSWGGTGQAGSQRSLLGSKLQAPAPAKCMALPALQTAGFPLEGLLGRSWEAHGGGLHGIGQNPTYGALPVHRGPVAADSSQEYKSHRPRRAALSHTVALKGLNTPQPKAGEEIGKDPFPFHRLGK